METQEENVIIVVNIEEGINLSAGNDGIFVTATLGGNKLESDPVVPGHSTKFECNLIFQTDRKSIKRMKTENYPIKIECFSVMGPLDKMDSAIKEQIGYILVPVRNIPVVPVHKAFNQRPRWYKLIGVSKEWRHHKPEFLLNFVITEKDFLTVDKTLLEPDLDCGDSIVIDSNPSKNMLQSQQGIFIRLLEEEGVLQVGNIDTHCDIFLVKILMRNLKNLDNILPDQGSSSTNTKEVTINYNLLGNHYACMPKRNFNRILGIREKIAIHFRTSLSTLRDYFEKIFHIPIEIYCNEKMVGSSKISLKNLFKTTSLEEFLEKYEGNDSTFEIEGLADVDPTGETLNDAQQKALIEFRFSIKYVATKKLQQHEMKQIELNVADKNLAAGDAPPSIPNLLDIRSESEISSKIQEVATYAEQFISKTSKSETTLARNPRHPIKPSFSYQIEKTDIASLLKDDDGDLRELSRIFSFNLQLKSISFYKKQESGIWMVGLQHPKADTPKCFVNNEIEDFENVIKFKDFELKLYFTSTSSKVLDIIKLADCTLSIKGPHQTNAKAILDCKSLMIGSKQNISGICQLENPAGEKIAIASIFVYLDDLGLNFNAPGKSSTEMDEAVAGLLDESLAYKMIEELEEWKAKQKESFMETLKQKEIKYLEQLKQDFLKKTAVQEEELVQKLEKYSQLVTVLEEAHKSLEEKGIDFYVQEQASRKIRHDLEKNFGDELMNYRERVRRLESDFEHEKRLAEMKYKELEARKILTESENDDLRETLNRLDLEVAELRNNVPKEKVNQLVEELKNLQENNEQLLHSKNFYKENWIKLVRQFHKFKNEHFQETKELIFDKRFDRICDVLQQETSKLNLDKNSLNHIKYCLDECSDD